MERANANEFGGHNHRLGLHGNKRPLVEGLGIDDSAVHIGKNLELVGDPEVITVRGEAVGDDALAHLLFAERLDHPVVDGLFPDPTVTLNRHASPGPGQVISWPGKHT
ncbi:MAG TPA: hypothetical protein VN776_00770 [Terracidiphilus sp.]|nr:hypothetical protein [Terracidiphilus sp.]